MPPIQVRPAGENAGAHLEPCLAALRELFAGAPGQVHLIQSGFAEPERFEPPLRQVQLHCSADELRDRFLAHPWQMLGDSPVELFARQHTYRGGQWRKNQYPRPPLDRLLCVYVDLDPYHLPQPISAGEAVERAFQRFADIGLDGPNHVDWSGNGREGGAYLRWLIQPLSGCIEPEGD